MNTVQEEKTMAAIPVLPSLRSLRSLLADPFRRIRSTTAQTIQTIRPVASAKLIRAAGYARVSTNSEDQKSSIEIQKQHFASIAAVHDDWEFTGIYYDIVSGTKAEKRPQLQQLLSDCKAGRVNLVLTKSVSRFARNTADELKIRQVEMRRKLNCFKDNRIGQSRELLSPIHSLGGSFVLNGTAGMGDCEEGADRNQWSSNDTDGCGAVEDGGNTADREKLFGSIIANVTVYNRERFAFHFLCGLTIISDLAAHDGSSCKPDNIHVPEIRRMEEA